MRLLKIKLEGIRSHLNTEIEFGEGINVFIGNTGSGKTSVLIGIEFALFGRDCGRDFAEILSWRKNRGRVILTIEHRGDIYTIIRGLLREKSSIRTDPTTLKILKNGRLFFSTERAREFNEKIKEILGFPKKINPMLLFETICYSKQDEIRKLLELSKEERQVYIDRALFLDKYRKIWEEMKDIIEYFEKKLEKFNTLIELKKEYVNKLQKISSELESSKKELKMINETYEDLAKKFGEVSSNLKEIKYKLETIRKDLELLTRLEERKKILISEIFSLEKELENLKGQIKKIEEVDIEEINQLKKELERVKNELFSLNARKGELEKTIKNLGGLKGRKCPICQRIISKELADNLINNAKTELEELLVKINELEEKARSLQESLKEKEEKLSIYLENKSLRKMVENVKSKLSIKRKELETIEEKLLELSKFKEMEMDLKKKLSELEQEYSLYLTELKELEGKRKALREKSIFLEKEKSYLEEKITEIEKSERKKEKLEKLIYTLKNLREEIRKIREIVRDRFLDSFGEEFVKWFRQLRKDSEYSVSIGKDYEPIIYDYEGKEVSLRNLSGGEKTSVALAYRLALSSVASELLGMQTLGLFILDEPTTGLDSDDIKNLVEVIQNLKLPQCIIVTHSRELKEAADYKFLVYKGPDGSKVISLED